VDAARVAGVVAGQQQLGAQRTRAAHLEPEGAVEVVETDRRAVDGPASRRDPRHAGGVADGSLRCHPEVPVRQHGQRDVVGTVHPAHASHAVGQDVPQHDPRVDRVGRDHADAGPVHDGHRLARVGVGAGGLDRCAEGRPDLPRVDPRTADGLVDDVDGRPGPDQGRAVDVVVGELLHRRRRHRGLRDRPDVPVEPAGVAVARDRRAVRGVRHRDTAVAVARREHLAGHGPGGATVDGDGGVDALVAEEVGRAAVDRAAERQPEAAVGVDPEVDRRAQLRPAGGEDAGHRALPAARRDRGVLVVVGPIGVVDDPHDVLGAVSRTGDRSLGEVG
jgi:hypothetical protein